ncbi:MAG: AmmeMemoRadiSam system protein B [Balneolaceae bacterium]|nr:AmmeMemoRadiSam system protein B [Balneolaceae bacterium]
MSSSKNTFLTGSVPSIRRDLEIIPVQHNGKTLLYFHDSMGYMPADFALDISVEPLLNLFNGSLSIQQMVSILKNQLSADDLLAFVQLLDDNFALQSKRFNQSKNEAEISFEKMSFRKPSLSGLSYPEDPELFDQEIQAILANTSLQPVEKANALYAPHIDLRVGASVYAESFSLIKNLRPKKVVILSTAHYAGFHSDLYDDCPFIGSAKTFQVPGREFETDTKTLHHLQKNASNSGFTLKDRAHRIEHSIEMHLIFLSAIWKHDFTIVPILVSGFDDLFYMPDGDLKDKIDHFSNLLNQVTDEDTFFLISGDLSHVGRKFGDQKPAVNMRNQVEEYDQKLLEISADGNTQKLLSQISKENDETRVCGFPPLYLYLNTFPGSEGDIINYHWWDEHERESAVSFGSILF